MPKYKKHYGQHHLKDASLCRPLVDYLRPEGQRVLEIGPGGGVLTEALVAAEARVIACEIDPEWAFVFDRRWPSGAVRTVMIDATRFPWHRLPAPTLVTGNLPFNVGTRLIEELLPHAEQVPHAAFMVQKEVADRLVAQPGDGAYGSLSVLVEAFAARRYLGTVKPRSFRPPPKVSAAFVGLQLRQPPFRGDRKAFSQMVRLAFAQRRKTLRNSLSSQWGREKTTAVLAAAQIDGGRRAETLNLEEFIELFSALGTYVSAI